jgi:hypothetical protein
VLTEQTGDLLIELADLLLEELQLLQSNVWFWPLKCEHNRQLGLLTTFDNGEEGITHAETKGFFTD